MALFLLAAILLSAADTLWAAEICCRCHGCFDDSPPFDDLPLPQCPEDLAINMKVYSRENPSTGETIDWHTIPPAFKSGVRTMILVQGLKDTAPFSNWLGDAKNAALKKVDYNVIIVGYRGIKVVSNFEQAFSNTRTIGAEIALVVNSTINKGKASKASIYCVGAGSGAHICGHLGQLIKIGRITGLDPTGIYFGDFDWSIGLNPSCADLVDVIHTDATTEIWYGAGTLKRLGHIDFYPHGGSHQRACQPMSAEVESALYKIKREIIIKSIPGCSSLRSQEYFVQSIPTPCFLCRHTCTNETQLPESCKESSEVVQSMGYYADTFPGRGIFYLTPISKKLFAQVYCSG